MWIMKGHQWHLEETTGPKNKEPLWSSSRTQALSESEDTAGPVSTAELKANYTTNRLKGRIMDKNKKQIRSQSVRIVHQDCKKNQSLKIKIS